MEKQSGERYTSTPVFFGDLALELITAGQYRGVGVIAVQGWTAPPHFHPYYEVHWVRNGSVTLRLEQHSITLEEGELLIVPPNCPHAVEGTESTLRHVSFGFSLSRSAVSFEKQSSRSGVFEYYDRYLRRLQDASLFPCSPLMQLGFQRLAELSEQGDNAPPFFPRTLVTMLFLEMADILRRATEPNAPAAEPEPESGSSEQLQRKWLIENYILEYYREPVSYDRLAEQLHLSRSQCAETVKKLTGSTLYALVRKQRMIIASHLIRNTELPLETVAEQVGYRSYSGFFEAYRTCFGVTPDRERQQLRADR